MLCSGVVLPQLPHLCKVEGYVGTQVLYPLEITCTHCSWAASSNGHPQVLEQWGWVSLLEHPRLSPCSPEWHGAGLAARPVGELGRAQLCLSPCQSVGVLWLRLCPGNSL